MNFFEHQHSARKRTRIMFFLFFLALVGVVGSVNFIAYFIFKMWVSEDINYKFFIIVSLITLTVILVSSLVEIIMLKDGGEAVARQAGGVEIDSDDNSFYIKRLRNIVEEISIASGVSVPKIFILSREDGINAFAAGFTPNDAAIAVTKGALEKLNRQELQGVIAHEFSHILNGDMRINIILMGLLHGIFILSLAGHKCLHVSISGASSNRTGTSSSGPIVLLGVGLIIVGYVGVFFGRMIKSYISRQREYLADASAIQFTREREGLAGALKKIAGIYQGSSFRERGNGEKVSHMLFGSAFSSSLMFATHPPIEERIARIDPSFDKKQVKALKEKWRTSSPNGYEEDLSLGFVSTQSRDKKHIQNIVQSSYMPHHLVYNKLDASNNNNNNNEHKDIKEKQFIDNLQGFDIPNWTLESIDKVSSSIGEASVEGFDYARDLINSIPFVLNDAARKTNKVMPLIYALLLDKDPKNSSSQKVILANHLNSQYLNTIKQLQDDLNSLHSKQRIPLLTVALSTLSKFSDEQLNEFCLIIDNLIHQDKNLTAFEYCLSTLIINNIKLWKNPSKANFGNKNVEDLKDQITILLNVMAKYGHKNENLSRFAFSSGFTYLYKNKIPHYDKDLDILQLDNIWDKLNTLSPNEKRKVIESLVATILEDGKIEDEEFDILRLVCSILQCPLPALI